MKNKIDFIYEYSDLKKLYTRVKVLTGHYEGLIIEFGGSTLAQWAEKRKVKNNFTFEYTIYQIPEQLKNYKLRGTPEFESFLAYLLVDVISDRNKDPKAKQKLDEALMAGGIKKSNINIDDSWYNYN
jgi:hypothetical protein